MKKRHRLPILLRKNQGVFQSIQNHWVSIILFGLLSLLLLFLSIFQPGTLYIISTIFSILLLVHSISGLIELKRLKRQLMENPDRTINKPVRQPIAYWAYFWFLPKH